ncbi:MAG: glycoside hydrolase family 57 protein [bacterium]
MPSVCFYVHVHQPFRIRRTSLFDIGNHAPYFDDEMNKRYLDRIVQKSYLPTNAALLDAIKKTNGKFKVSFSITGTILEQLEQYHPEVIESFQRLVNTGNAEIVAETYYHSLAFLYSKDEFKRQVELQQKKLESLFNVKPTVFRNTELIYSNEIAQLVGEMGYKGILAEGADHVLGWRSPNFVYRSQTSHGMPILLRNYRLSDDIAFRFSNKEWESWPLTADKFAQWVHKVNGSGEIINLFMDYETFGEHQWESTGIFDFLRAMPHEILRHPDMDFKTVSEIVENYHPVADLDIPYIVTWADVERDLSAWLGNSMQQKAIKRLYEFEEAVMTLGDEKLLDAWRKLQTSDHFYYMCTKWFSDGDVHKYFNPHESPYECFISFMNIMKDFEIYLEKNISELAERSPQKSRNTIQNALCQLKKSLKIKNRTAHS